MSIMCENPTTPSQDTPAIPKVQLELDADQIQTVINGLYRMRDEARQYELTSRVNKEPRPTDTCCAAHKYIYERNLSANREMAMRVEKSTILIDMVEAAAAQQLNSPEGETPEQ